MIESLVVKRNPIVIILRDNNDQLITDKTCIIW